MALKHLDQSLCLRQCRANDIIISSGNRLFCTNCFAIEE